MIRYPRRFRCRGPIVTPPNLRPRLQSYTWYPHSDRDGYEDMLLGVFGSIIRGLSQRPMPYSVLLAWLKDKDNRQKLGILEYHTWEAEGGYVQGIQVTKPPRLSPKLIASLPLLKRPKL